MNMSLRRRVQFGLGGAVLLLVTGCGPNPGLDVGLRHQGVPVLFGLPTPSAQSTPSSPPLAGELVPNFPAPLTAPPPPFEVSTPTPVATPTPIPCPTPSPVTFPKETASTTATRPPAATPYVFRYSGTQTFNSGTATQTVKALPVSGTNEVKHVSPVASDGHYTFDVVENYNSRTTTTTYLVEPNSTTSAQPLQTMQAGLYLSAQVTVDSDGTQSNFQPQPPVELMPFPANPGTQFQSAGVDPLNQEAMNEESPGGGQVGGTERVPACGAVVDAWHVEIVGQIVRGGGGTTTNFDEVFDVATQYGGLVVAEHLKENGTDQKSGQPYSYDITKTIDTVPQDASAT